MSESTKDMLTGYVERAAETIREYARQIESGEYGNRWLVQSYDEPVDHNYDDIIADSEEAAIAIAQARSGQSHDNWEAERDTFEIGEPTIVDEYGNESPISEWPLSVEVKIGRPLAVVIATGGPHIEIAQDLSNGSAKLAGYWGGEQVYRYGGEFSTVLDYLTGPLYDEAPEEYK
ncbi:hypothetical protein SEA_SUPERPHIKIMAN_208 [Mycobacterium phage Superphikiman]|uniref:Uncharacterized protein n=1 Tax=Mycobacterium phage Superphikiman TaxID=2041551 RepID=A0A2D2W4D1_9CAUD|nr:hypothetical protein SEA_SUPERPHIKIMAN_208 [Mycobacterium phage Superphikiman]